MLGVTLSSPMDDISESDYVELNAYGLENELSSDISENELSNEYDNEYDAEAENEYEVNGRKGGGGGIGIFAFPIGKRTI